MRINTRTWLGIGAAAIGLLAVASVNARDWLIHNHPSGDPKPSAADVAVTREIVAAAKAVGVNVHDHLVIGAQGAASLKTLGLM